MRKFILPILMLESTIFPIIASTITPNTQSDEKFALSCQPHKSSSERLGLEYFLAEDYSKSAEFYQKALEKDPHNLDLNHMLQLAQDNNIAQVQVAVPSPYYFDRDQLLGEAVIAKGVLPSESAAPYFYFHKSTREFLYRGRQIVSFPIHKVFTLTQWVCGKMVGYKDEIWTNWYRRPLTLGLLTMGYMRNLLFANNLTNVYPQGTLIGFQSKGQQPPEGVKHYRTANGSWNNLSDPMEGAAGTRFMRNVANTAIYIPTAEELLTPNPREISRRLLTRTGAMKEVPFLNMLAVSWIQFMVHDWVSHGENYHPEVYAVPFEKDDPARKLYGQTKMFVPKTQKDPTRSSREPTPVTYINEVTHWWDGSQIYGSNQDTQDKIRSHIDGKLSLNPNRTLPLDKDGIAITGFTRNWWVGLEMLHTLFVQEHNAICDALKANYPSMDDNHLFNTARLINAAVMAKIHTVEWTPAILPNETLQAAMNSNWYGLATYFFRDKNHRKVVTDFKIMDAGLGGEVGNPINKKIKPFGFSEEFVEVYRLHSLLPETLDLHHLSNRTSVTPYPFVQSRQAGSAKLTKAYTIADLLSSFGVQNPGQLVLNNYPKFMQELSIPGNPLYDMGAVDILRARERGVPRYNEFRRQIGLNPIKTFADLTDDQEQIKTLQDLYKDVEKLDLMIGTLAEAYRPTGYGFGETMYQIFILNASRRLAADRFYTDNYNEETYTKVGLDWVDQADFKTVLLRHYPELETTGLANVLNAFEPWDTGGPLAPSRHPLLYLKKD